jgi:putative ABC transport system ATP-binding protein
MNLIHFYNVLPKPLADTPISGNVWNRNFALFKGRKYVVQAEAGKGKTTLLNIIYGIRKDYKGETFFDDENILPFSPDRFANLRSQNISYLFQDLRMFPELTARENILLKPGCKYTNAHIDVWAEKLGVPKHLDKICRTLSLGQQQRIAMIRALVQPFEWLLLDEPFSHLDTANAQAMLELILQRTEEEKAGIIVTSLGDLSLFQDFERLTL